jgi:hypothetical protein
VRVPTCEGAFPHCIECYRMARDLRLEEKWAQTVLARAIGVPVEQYDDGSRPGMHDLTFVRAGAREAVEVTAAANSGAIELWNFLESGDRWIAKQLQGGWSVEFTPVPRSRRTKNFKGELEALLAKLEMLHIPVVDRDHPAPADLGEAVSRLGIVHARQVPTDFPGSIYPLPSQEAEDPGIPQGRMQMTLPSWVSRFLKSPRNDDVRSKLERSDSARRHAFIVVPPFSTAPSSVVALLLQNAPASALHPPDLPAEVTDVWVASTWALGAGLTWAPGSGWRRFSTAYG